MKSKNFFFLCIFLFGISAMAQTSDQRVGELISNQRYFALQREYNQSKDSLSPFMKVLSKSLLNSFFNKPQDAIASINELLQNHQESLGGQSVSMAILLAENQAEIGNYKEAAKIYNDILQQVSQYLDKETLEKFTNNYKLYNTLSTINPIKVNKPNRDCIIPITKNQLGIMEVPVKIAEKSWNFVFDTGATHCAISQSLAKEIGIKVLADSILLNGSFNAQLGILDKLNLGDIVIENILFYILPPFEKIDAHFSNNNSFNMVLGLPVIKTLGVIEITHDKMYIPVNYSNQSMEKNMMIMSNYPYVEASSKGESLIFTFDTGDNKASLSNFYYDKHKEKILSTGKPDSVRVGHAEDIAIRNGFSIENFPLQIGKKDITFSSIFVEKDNLLIPNPLKIDGSLGMLLFEKSSKITLNFDRMSLIIE